MSVEEIIDWVSLNIAKIKIGFDSERDKDDYEKVKRFKNEIESTKTELEMKINELYANICRESDIADVPNDLKLLIAKTIEKRQETFGIDDISEIVLEPNEIEQMINSEPISKDSTIEKVAYYAAIAPMIIDDAVFDGNKIICSDNFVLQYEEPENEMFKFNNQEEQIEDATIEIKKHEIQNILSNSNDIAALEQIDKIIKSDYQNGLGLDAALGVVEQKLRIDDNLSEFLKKPLSASALNLVLENLKNGQELGFRDDNYTLFTKLSVFSRIINDTSLDKNSSEYISILSKMKDADKELFELISQNPNLYMQLQSEFKETEAQNLAIFFAGKSQAISREDTLGMLEKFKEEHKGKEFVPIEKQRNAEPIQAPASKSVTEEEKKENLKKTLQGIMNVKGKEGCKEFLNRLFESGKNIELAIDTALELGFVEEACERMITNGLDNTELMEKAVKLDNNAVVASMKNALEDNGNLSNKAQDVIMRLSQKSKAIRAIEIHDFAKEKEISEDEER